MKSFRHLILRNLSKIGCLITEESSKAGQHKHLAGYLEFPGGKIEPGETPERCLIRELEEELQIKVEALQYLAENTHVYETMTVTIKAYLCRFLEGEFVLTDHEEIKWVSIGELLEYELAPADIPFIKFINNSGD